MAVRRTRIFTVLLAAVLFCQHLAVSSGSTHWLVTEEGLITQQVNSEYNLKEPHDLITFLHQEERAKEVQEWERMLELQKEKIERDEDKDPELEQRFLRTDKDCRDAGTALTEIDLYTKTVMSLENKGIRAVDHIDIDLPNPKKFRRPNCTRILDLPVSMRAYDHLTGVQDRKNISSVAEPDLIYLLPADEGFDRIGHLIYKALMKNKTSWVLYNFASYFWRVHGNAEQVIECARKALHFSPHEWTNVALLNMANALHRSHYSADAAIMGEAAIAGNQDLEVIYFMLGNIYAALGQYTKSINRFQEALNLSPDLEVADKRMSAVLCHKKLEAALEAQHTSLQRTLAELREYQVKQDQLNDMQQVFKKARRNPDEQYENNMDFHHAKLLQGMAEDSTNCELTDVGSGTHIYICKQDYYTQGEVFGQPLEVTVIEAADTGSICNNCIRLPNGEENCFNLSSMPSSNIATTYNSYLSPPRPVSTPLWQNDDWPSRDDCSDITSAETVDWFEYAPTHLGPDNKGLNATPTVTDDLFLGKDEMITLPWFSPICVTIDDIEDGDTAMDYVEGVAFRTKLGLTENLKSLKSTFLSYGSSSYINVDEMGHRVMTALEKSKDPKAKWMLYNLGGLYWQIGGNNYHGVECFRRALYFTPIEYADIPLVNAANIMLRLKRPHDAVQLLRMALVVNSTEPMTHFTLANALAAQRNFSQAAQQYKLALNFNPSYKKSLEALKIIKCHLKKAAENLELASDPGKEHAHGLNTGVESEDVGESMRTTEGNIQRESRTVCHHVDGKRECKIEVRTRAIVPNEDPAECASVEEKETKKERKMDKEKGKQRKAGAASEGVQKPPQTTSYTTSGQMNGSGQLNTVEEPSRRIIEKQIYNVRMLEPIGGAGVGKRVTFNIKDMGPPGTAPNPAQGPHIPAAPAPGIDLSELLHSTRLPWPSAEECQHFKRLNLRAFYSTWLSVSAKDVSIPDFVDFSKRPGPTLTPLCDPTIGPSMHTMDHLEAMKHMESFNLSAEQGLKEILLTLGGRQVETVEAIGTRITMAMLEHPESWVVYNLAGLYWRVEGHAAMALNCLRLALHYSPRDKMDIALISMANIFHGAGWLQDGIIVAKMAVDIAPHMVINHFTLANVYSAQGQFDKAIQYYESTLLLQNEFQPAVERLKTIQCNVIQWMDGHPPSS